MQKQIIYAKLIPRLFSMTFDLLIISLTLSKIVGMLYNIVFYCLFMDLFTESMQISIWSSAQDVAHSEEFITVFSNHPNAMQRIIILQSITFITLMSLMGAYFVMSWRKYNTTLGGLIMNLKVVDADHFETASVKSLIKRYLAFALSIIGIWSILTNERKMALHDKIANTVVIKK